MMNTKSFVSLGLLLLVTVGCGKKSTNKVSIKNKGSDTLVQVAQAWAEAYGEEKPEVSVQVSGGGSGTGISALINGTIDIANASRAIKESEIQEIKDKLGKDVNEYIVGFDGIAVYTHKDNPMTSISLAQLKGIYAEGGEISDWSGVTSDFTGEIQRSSRQNNSGTYAFFRDTVCGKGGEFKQGANTLSGSKEIVEFVAKTPLAIGYSGMGYKNDEVNWLSVSSEDGGEAYEPTSENVLNKNYPIARPLYLYTVGEESPEVKAYIEWIKNAAGQKIVADQKFVPMS